MFVDQRSSVPDRRESGIRTQIMLDAAPLCCTFIDENGRIADCNQAALHLFGLNDKQEYVDNFHDLSPMLQPNGQPSYEEINRHIHTVFECGCEVFEWMHQKPDGTPIPVEITLTRIRRGEGYIIVGYTRDLRELKAAEAERREAEERTQIMLDATPLCSNFWDEQCRNIDCNQEAVNLFDLPNKQAYLDHFPELSPEYQPNGKPSSEEALRHIRAAFANGREVFEWMHQKLDGTPIPAQITLVRVKRGDRYIVAGYTRDLRALKATIVERDQERALLKQVLDFSPMCFTILVDDVVRFATPFFQDLMGIQVNDAIVDYFEQLEEHEALDRELIQNQSVNWRPVRLKSKGGDVKDMLANLFYTDYYGRRGVMMWLIDVTEMKKVEQELRLARDAARESDRAKSEFLANMSHEIRTPMNAILGMTNLVLRTDVNEKQRDYLLKTEQSANSLLRIINDILDFSKIEAGKLEIEQVNFSLGQVLQGVLDVVVTRVGDKPLTIRTNVHSDVPDQLLGDPLRLNQVLVNLLSNAVKFTNEGEILVDVRPQSGDREHATLLFKVSDNGIGMNEDQVKGLFTPFMQADSSITRKYGGTGLGLAISKSLVNLMGGHIWCESAPGRGTTFQFTVKFRIDQNKTKQAEHQAAKREGGAQIGAGFKVLLAEDNEINQIVARELLQLEGFDVDIVSNGLEAVEKAKNNDYTLILMDIQMPEMDGFSATRLIRQQPQFEKIPIIAMTAHAMSGDREKCLDAGMNDHITKPIDPEAMFQTIAQWLPDRP